MEKLRSGGRPAHSVFYSILLIIVRNNCPLVKRKTLPRRTFCAENRDSIHTGCRPRSRLFQIHPAQPHQARRGQAVFGFQIVLGAAVFLLVYGLAPLDVANDAFCRGGYIEKDIQQHYAGWLFYRSSALGWPLGVTQAVNAPQGVSVAYTDSIPLLAVLCRPLAAALGGTFQYFGWFTLVCFALQGGFAALLCGLFAPLGRLGSVLALAISYGFFAMLASRSVTGFLEVLLAAGIFWLLPAAVPRRAGQLIAPGREQKIAPLILGDRLEAAATALREVSSTTREVADHLKKSTA